MDRIDTFVEQTIDEWDDQLDLTIYVHKEGKEFPGSLTEVNAKIREALQQGCKILTEDNWGKTDAERKKEVRKRLIVDAEKRLAAKLENRATYDRLIAKLEHWKE